MKFAVVLAVLASADLKAEFDAATITEGFGKWGFLNQPFVSAKLQMDANGTVMGYMKDMSNGKTVYTKMAFTKGGVPIKQEVEATAGKKIADGHNRLPNPFIAAPVATEAECDTVLFSQRISHEGESAAKKTAREQNAKGTNGGQLLALKDPATTVKDGEVEDARLLQANEVLEVYTVLRPSEDNLCVTLMRRDPEPSKKSRIPKGITLQEKCRSYAEASKDVEFTKVHDNFQYSEETGNRSKQQSWEMCFGEMCTFMQKVAKRVRVVKRIPREGKEDRLQNRRINGTFVYKTYKLNENKAQKVEFETMMKECVNPEELPSPSDNIKFSKCGEIIKADMNGSMYLFDGKRESTNDMMEFDPKKIQKDDVAANEKHGKGPLPAQAKDFGIALREGASDAVTVAACVFGLLF